MFSEIGTVGSRRLAAVEERDHETDACSRVDAVSGLVACVLQRDAATCESLASLTLPDTTITLAQTGRGRRVHAPGGPAAAADNAVTPICPRSAASRRR